MPSAHKLVVALRGTEQYERYLKRLAAAVRKSGVRGVNTPNALAEYALVVLGHSYLLDVPRRIPPQGTNRHGEPKAKATPPTP